MATEVLALGISRETMVKANAPFFLAECRRKTYAKSYNISVGIASLFDRPSLLCTRHSDVLPPLELSDDELISATTDWTSVSSKLSTSGWSTEDVYYPTSFLRMRLRWAQLREEVLDVSLQTPNTAMVDSIW
jgi:hypothetical protein